MQYSSCVTSRGECVEGELGVLARERIGVVLDTTADGRREHNATQQRRRLGGDPSGHSDVKQTAM